MNYREIFSKPSEISTKEITSNSEDILKMRYYMNKADGQKEKTFSELCRRVSRILTSVDNSELVLKKTIEKSIYNDMMSQRFLFNSPCLFNAGKGLSTNSKYGQYLYISSDSMTDDIYTIIKENVSSNQMLFACFVIDVPDSIEGIFDSVKKAAIISKSGGGVGANFGKIREKNALIKNGEIGKSSGPVSFMKTWNTMGEVVMQGGARRSALMGMLYSNHPDIEEFINAKTEEGVLSYFNISVAIDNQFMKAVKDNLDYCLISPKNNTVVRTVKARDLFDKICNNAWKRGDPGIFFVDLANEDSLLKLNKDYEIDSTNPCFVGETLVTMADGSQKRIDEIRVGDMVESYNHNTNQIENKKVIWAGKTKDTNDLVELVIHVKDDYEDDWINTICTPEHKIWSEDENNYKEAKELNQEENLLGYTRDYTIHTKIKLDSNIVPVYDINVEDNHNFFANDILVHNCGEKKVAPVVVRTAIILPKVYTH